MNFIKSISLLLACLVMLVGCTGNTTEGGMEIPKPTDLGISTSTTAEKTEEPETAVNTVLPTVTLTQLPDTVLDVTLGPDTVTPTPTAVTPPPSKDTPEKPELYNDYVESDFDTAIDCESFLDVDIYRYSKGNMIKGSLAVVSREFGYNSKYTNELVVIREERDDKIEVALWGIQCTPEMLDALELLNQSYASTFPDAEKKLMVSGGFKKSDELGDAAYYSEHTTGNLVSLKLWDGTYPHLFESYGCGNEREWILDNCHRFGLVQRYVSGKEDVTGVVGNLSQYRYVGLPHSYYMTEFSLSLEEYTDLISGYTFDLPLVYTDPTGDEYEIYYVKCDDQDGVTDIPVKKGMTPYISGDNQGGFVVTVKVKESYSLEYLLLCGAVNGVVRRDSGKYSVERSVFSANGQEKESTFEYTVTPTEFEAVSSLGEIYSYSDGVLTVTDGAGNTVISEYTYDDALSKYCPKALGKGYVVLPCEENFSVAKVSLVDEITVIHMVLVDDNVADTLYKEYFDRPGKLYDIELYYVISNGILESFTFKGYNNDNEKITVTTTYIYDEV